jgi:uncharacterized protein (DUF2062 family)/2-polyprenyl-3-methyl-5-hydroxy-6-metoxy-1,4-benzoquinol methylase
LNRGELRSKARAAWRRLRGGELTPTRAALSVAVGLAIGVTPLYGAHIFLVLAVCVPLGLDAPVSYLAANVSIPPLAPFLALAEVEIGAWLLTGRALPLDAARLRETGAWTFARELVLGTAIFAPAAALTGGLLTYALVSLARSNAPSSAFDEAVDRVASRYANGRRAAYYYARGKLRGDPVVRRIWELGAKEPLGEVVDAGAGRGQLGILLVESGAASGCTGFDWDAGKVKDATHAADGLPATFEEADLRTKDLPACDTVLLVDVLHYLTDAEQDTLLERAARAARRGVIVRDIDPDRGFRSAVTRVQEAITTTLGYNRGARVAPRPIASIERVLRDGGLDVTTEPCWTGTPYANVLVCGTRRAGGKAP